MSKITTEESTDWSGNRIVKIFRDHTRVGTAITRKASLEEQLLVGEEEELTELRDIDGNIISTSRVRENNSLFAALGLSEDTYLDVQYVEKAPDDEYPPPDEDEHQTGWLNPTNAAEEEVVASIRHAIHEHNSNSTPLSVVISFIAVIGLIIFGVYATFL